MAVSTPELVLERELADIRELLAAGDVEESRRRVERLAVKWPDSDSVRRMSIVLAPPEVRVLTGGPSRRLNRERAWLKANAHRYPGCWLAVLGDDLLAAHPRLATVIERARAVPDGSEALLHFQSGPES